MEVLAKHHLVTSANADVSETFDSISSQNILTEILKVCNGPLFPVTSGLLLELKISALCLQQFNPEFKFCSFRVSGHQVKRKRTILPFR